MSVWGSLRLSCMFRPTMSFANYDIFVQEAFGQYYDYDAVCATHVSSSPDRQTIDIQTDSLDGGGF
jgi:hypothetical protein